MDERRQKGDTHSDFRIIVDRAAYGAAAKLGHAEKAVSVSGSANSPYANTTVLPLL